MIPGTRSDGHLVLVNQTPAWLPPRPRIVVDTTACPRCGGSGEVQVGSRREADTGMPILTDCPACFGSGSVSLELAGVCTDCGFTYWLEDGCPHDGHACHDCAPSLCDDCGVAAADDAGFDPIRWGARH